MSSKLATGMVIKSGVLAVTLRLSMLRRPLHDAVDSDCIEIVRLLLAAGADINLTTYSGKTVESLACSHDMRAFLRGSV